MDGLIIRQPWIDKILAGDKTWELRGSRTHKRSRIALIQSGSGLVVGECDLIDCIGPLDKLMFTKNIDKHGSSYSFEELPYKQTFAWILRNAKRYQTPKPYTHLQGAIIWVKI